MKKLYVYADFDWLDTQLIGELSCESVRGSQTYGFSYDKEWLARYGDVFLSEDLQNYTGIQYTRPECDIFACFSDALPDRWGRTLLNRREQIAATDEKRAVRRLTSFDYLMGIDDTGAAFERSSDPLLDDLTLYLTQFTLGVVPSTEDTDNILSPILHKKEIWGVDLYTCGLSDPVISDFREMLAGPGAVENTLKHYVN